MPDFLGRQPEGRALILSARAGRSVVLVGPSGYGKSALLAELAPALEAVALTLRIPRAAPFGTFLNDLAGALLAAGVRLPGTDLAGWKKAHAGNDLKARSLVSALRDYRTTGAVAPVILVDDATGLTQSMVPALLALAEHAAVVCAVQLDTIRKAGLSRFWNRCDRVDLGPLDRADARALVDDLTTRYAIVAEDIGACKNRVLSMSEGVPGDTAQLAAQAEQKCAALVDAQAKVTALRAQFQAQRGPLRAEVQAARDDVQRYAALVAQDAATRQEWHQAQARARAAETRLDALAMQESAAVSAADAQARTLALEIKGLQARLTAASAAQVVRSPVAGEVVEIRQGAATARGLSVEVVILVRAAGQQPPTEPPDKPGAQSSERRRQTVETAWQHRRPPQHPAPA